MEKHFIEVLARTIIEVEADSKEMAMDKAEAIADNMNDVAYKANSGNDYVYIDSIRCVGADTKLVKIYKDLYKSKYRA